MYEGGRWTGVVKEVKILMKFWTVIEGKEVSFKRHP